MNDGVWDGWIGVDDINEENVWRNVKGENVDYRPWSAGQPDNCCGGQNCVWQGINPNMRWDDQVCSYKFNYAICHRSRVTQGITITKTFTGTLNAPNKVQLGQKIAVSYTGNTNHVYQLGLERCTALFDANSFPLTFINSFCWESPIVVRG
ncbi:unnamed protein product [Oikopleura dioica]|uniref:C-type lectin domain-containing protein n=1 Tax=Oikopleura dioica TaxID=34765 RepID=E4Y3G2_OIKDI|nr:unnamed protein product [Oikopleura dioica]